jgi:surface polysaccharide O-acyltransferase-like enzyme
MTKTETQKYKGREEKLTRICTIWGIGFILFYLMCGGLLYFGIAEADFLNNPQGIMAIIYLLSVRCFIAFFGPAYLNQPNPNAWLD